MKTYPLGLIKLSVHRTVVIGGGKVALRKIHSLLEAGAAITVISPKLIYELAELSSTGAFVWQQRAYQHGDLAGAFVVIAATDDAAVNQEIWEEAQQERCLINVVDDPARSNFIVPALVRRGEFTIAISTGGASPALARRTREKLETEFGPEYEHLAALLGELRPILLAAYPAGKARQQAALEVIDSDLIEILKHDGYEKAKDYALNILKPDNDKDRET